MQIVHSCLSQMFSLMMQEIIHRKQLVMERNLVTTHSLIHLQDFTFCNCSRSHHYLQLPRHCASSRLQDSSPICEWSDHHLLMPAYEDLLGSN
uniref:Putative ovule protein n=1 Tax=Solanum chacoense TaxID=4108 RepID=A0A0V0GX23_SOLCH